MKYLFYALCAGLALCAAPGHAVTYQDILSAATNPHDLSRQALVTMFGEVVINPLATGGRTIIGNLFAVFNGIITIFAIVWFMFIGLRHILGAGHQGQVFSGGRDITGTLSTVAGFLMIVPSGNGWSLAQLLMLWGAGIMGVGSANVMVVTAADNIASGYSMTVQPVHASTLASARGIFEMQLCRHSLNATLDDYARTMRTTTGHMVQSSKEAAGRYTVSISNGSGSCGSASVSVKSNTTISPSGLSGFFNPFSADDYSKVMAAQKKALDGMVAELDSAAQQYVSGYLSRRDTDTGDLPDAETVIHRAADNYEKMVQAALPANNNEAAMNKALTEYIKTYGWVSLGAWYQTFATANQRLADLANRVPVVMGQSAMGAVGDTDLLVAVNNSYKAQRQNSPYTAPLGTAFARADAGTVSTDSPQSIMMQTVGTYGVRLTNRIATEWSGTGTSSAQVNPLIKMKNVGDYTMGAAEGIWVTFTASRVAAAGGFKNFVGRIIDFATGTGSAIEKGLDAISPVLHFLLFLLFTSGFTLSVYLPLIPFVFWMTGIGNWVVSVLIGCAAGPLWGATHLGTSQDRGSRAAYGYIYLIDAMIRPSLMVFGFFFASVAVVAAGTILHALFGAALVNAQSDSMTGIFSVAGFLMVYARICTTLVAAVFALQAYLPDHVINFLGGRDGANTLGSLASSVKEIMIAGNRNMRGTPGVEKQRSGNTPSEDKDGIKG